MTNWA
jgi:fructose-bisphosphate aldolase, class II